MNYLKLISIFWQIDEQRSFSANETRLYFYLLKIANSFFWQTEWFEYGDEKMKAYVGVSSAVLRTARNNLKEVHLIDFIVGGAGQRVKTRYQILTPNLNPNLNPLYNNKIKTKTNNKRDERFSKREYVASASDFDE
ncbi:MAG: hypothetical protein LBI15_03090 [Dysgonamonadaceae bacterium]|jgi:hypothetical protein|nr:hypothetical protein [Dysgonamonadaceae bacterium]